MKEDEKFLSASLKESMHKNKLVRIATAETNKQNDALKDFFNKNMPDWDSKSHAKRFAGDGSKNLNNDMKSQTHASDKLQSDQ